VIFLSLFYIFTPECKKTGAKLLIFPEGTVNHGRNGDFLPFKKGGFAAAIASQVTVGKNLVSRKNFLTYNLFIFLHLFHSTHNNSSNSVTKNSIAINVCVKP
jgi:1-acyl-sn-glycerol-3-phosphate acyltransferase